MHEYNLSYTYTFKENLAPSSTKCLPASFGFDLEHFVVPGASGFSNGQRYGKNSFSTEICVRLLEWSRDLPPMQSSDPSQACDPPSFRTTYGCRNMQINEFPIPRLSVSWGGGEGKEGPGAYISRATHLARPSLTENSDVFLQLASCHLTA